MTRGRADSEAARRRRTARLLGAAVSSAALLFLACARGGEWARTIGWRDPELLRLLQHEEPGDAEAVVLADEGKVEVSGEWQMGFTLFERHRIVKILNRRGERFANVAVPYGADSRVELLQARCISPQGEISVVEPKKVYDVNLYPSFVFYSDQRAKLFAVPGIEPGSVVEYRYRVRTPTRSFGHSWVFQEDVPVLRSRFTLLAPGEWELIYRVHGLALEPHVTRAPAGFKATYVWEAKDIPPLSRELSMPPPRECFARVELSPAGMKTWNDVATWYHGLAAPQMKATKQVSRLASTLIAGCETEMDKLKALATWVRDNVRYLAVEIGIGGFQPHAAQEVLANRYGDCKDMATLLCAMAASVGIEADQVLVSTWQNGVPDTSLPSPFHFNHAMVFVPAIGDSGLWVDPTDKGTPFGSLPWYDQGVFVLHVKGDGTGSVRRTPRRPASENQTVERWHARIDEQGSAEVDGETVLRGAPAYELRKELAALNTAERTRWLESHLARRCPAITLKSWHVAGLEPDTDSLRFSYSFSSSAFAMRSAGQLVVRPAQFCRLDLPELFRSPTRVHPIRFRFGMVQEFLLSADTPSGWKMLSPPVSDSTTCAHGAAKWQWFPTSSGLFASARYSLSGEEVSPTEYPAFRTFLNNVELGDLREVRLGRD
ncbi:MAG: DUF3857 domain-containing protein [Calditrichaeota bacterium]|nr:DUF3857 domain-containing protein [Calditrichota bacterium]